MIKIKMLISLFLLLILNGFMTKAQPIPAELMLGNKYGTLKMIVSKNFSQTSKFGIFHINILQFDYLHDSENDLMLQDLVFFEPIKNFRITGGGLYTGKTGFLTTTGMQYKLNKKSLFLLLSTRINFRDSGNEGDIFSILQLTPIINEKLNFVAGIQSLFLFNGDGNIKSMQDLRQDLDLRILKSELQQDWNRLDQITRASVTSGFLSRKIFFDPSNSSQTPHYQQQRNTILTKPIKNA